MNADIETIAVDSEQADTSPEIAAAVAHIMASRPTFKVGDRVRVTGAIAECRQDWGRFGTILGHRDCQLGLTGWISQIYADDEYNHPVCVEMDSYGLGFTALMMNAAELEPIP